MRDETLTLTLSLPLPRTSFSPLCLSRSHWQREAVMWSHSTVHNVRQAGRVRDLRESTVTNLLYSLKETESQLKICCSAARAWRAREVFLHQMRIFLPFDWSPKIEKQREFPATHSTPFSSLARVKVHK